MTARIRSQQRDDGFMLVELLVVLALLLVIGGALLTMLSRGSRAEPRITDQALRLDEARSVLNRMTRDLRQSYAFVSTASDRIDFLTFVRGGSGSAVQRRVAYSCTDGTCARYELTADPLAPLPASGDRIVSNVQNSDVFSFVPDGVNPKVVRIKLALSVPGRSKTITLADGVDLRNGA